MSNDIQVLRELAQEYAEVAADPIQDIRRDLWSKHNSLERTRPLVLTTFGMWNVWCGEVFGDDKMQCEDAFYRDRERRLRMLLFQADLNDDCIFEPWFTEDAVFGDAGQWEWLWGLEVKRIPPDYEGGAVRYENPLKQLADVSEFIAPQHVVNEEATKRNVDRIGEAIGDIVEINRGRRPILGDWHGEISYDLGMLRGIEQLMMDMMDDPDGLHKVSSFISENVIRVQDDAEAAGDFTLTTQKNQAMTYASELPRPAANKGPVKRSDLWVFCASQELALVSPDMHEEFVLNYQIPIMSSYGLSAYGCCEDLTRKIDMLRKVPNLRRIAVSPMADIARSAEQIGTDYVISWRPSPSDHVSHRFDEEWVRGDIRHALEVSKGGHIDITLKDIETVDGDPARLKTWTRIVQEECQKFA